MAVTGSGPGTWLRGRRRECDALDRLVANARTGRSTVLVIRGEAGIGKSALLEYVRDNASGLRIARLAGVESEMEMAYGGLHQLCGPMLDHLQRLPGPQRDALGTAFGLSSGAPPDRFLVGLAVLSLLAEVAEATPLICLIDDTQWLDRVSTQTLGFVARRAQADRVAFVFAVRAPGDVPELKGLPDLELQGLADDDARVLLQSAIPGRLDDLVRDRIVAETRGNPLALLELPHGLTGADLAGGFALPDASSLASQIEDSFLRRIHSLPPQSQRLLLTAAAEPVGDVTLLWRAADRLGIGVEAAAPAQSAGLIAFGAWVRFRHPLVRSAAYRAGEPHERQQVHGALADATDVDIDPDRWAWHRAHAAAGPEEAVATALERSADRARARGGIAAAAAFLAQATELTPEPAARAVRALAAARAKFEAGSPDQAKVLLTAATNGPIDDLHRAQIALLHAQMVFARSRGRAAPPLLLEAANRLAPLDPALARDTYLEAIGTATFAARLSGKPGVREIAAAARIAPPGPRPPRLTDLLLDGLAIKHTEGYVAGVPALQLALNAFRREGAQGDGKPLRWLWQAWLVAGELWDDEAWHELAVRAVQLAREAGALTALLVLLDYRAGIHVHAGEFAAASVLMEEATALSEVTGNAAVNYSALLLLAWRGQEAETLVRVAARTSDANAKGEGRAIGLGLYVTSLLYNGLGRYDLALAAAQQACEYEDNAFFNFSLAELVEAGTRCGDPGAAATALETLEERTTAAGTQWALGIRSRSRALASSGDAAESLYRDAIERLGQSRITVHLARAHLLFGEWLRREQRRLDARDELRLAHRMFSQMGAEGFAERARRELAATGESVRASTAAARDVLTAQEAQIAKLAAEGLTNPEIGAQLFISPHTVEWHLRKVFTKLGVTSRKQLSGPLSLVAGATLP
ncbi:MAG: AAA family ATPase [Nakamurella sp.]